MPRHRNPYHIVDAAEILERDIIQGEEWTLFTLLPLLENQLECIKWLVRRRLLRNSKECERCNNLATLNGYQQGLDGYRWRCNNCNWTASIRQDSYFSKSHLLLHKVVQMIYFWSINFPQVLVIQELGLQKKTVVDWFNYFREECCIWVDNSLQPIGGPNENLEDSLVEMSSFRDVVIHEQNFVDTDDDAVPTQSIESLWKRAIKKLRNQSGTSQALFPPYIKEVVWRENYCKAANNNIFSCFLRMIGEAYNLQ